MINILAKIILTILIRLDSYYAYFIPASFFFSRVTIPARVRNSDHHFKILALITLTQRAIAEINTQNLHLLGHPLEYCNYAVGFIHLSV